MAWHRFGGRHNGMAPGSGGSTGFRGSCWETWAQAGRCGQRVCGACKLPVWGKG